MPVYSTQPVPVVAPEVQYERIAFRCSFNGKVSGGQIVDQGTLALVGVKYRKLQDPNTGKVYLDVLGINEAAEKAASLMFGQDPTDDQLMNGIGEIVTQYVGAEGQVSLSFSWRVEAGDVCGMVHLTIKPETGDEIVRMTGNTNELEAQDPQFALVFAQVIQLLSTWCTAKGW